MTPSQIRVDPGSSSSITNSSRTSTSPRPPSTILRTTKVSSISNSSKVILNSSRVIPSSKEELPSISISNNNKECKMLTEGEREKKTRNLKASVKCYHIHTFLVYIFALKNTSSSQILHISVLLSQVSYAQRVLPYQLIHRIRCKV